ncbi:hypothetical protein QOT17_022225 [Balamuthia mandrillaris]
MASSGGGGSRSSAQLSSNSSNRSSSGTSEMIPRVLKVKKVDKFIPIWRDRGSGGRVPNVTFYRPIVPPGYFSVGDVARPYYDPQPKGEAGGEEPVYVVSERNPLFPEYLRKPVDWREVWNDRGTRCKIPCSMWLPVPPPGFVSLGFVITADHNKPPLDIIRCVHHSVAHPAKCSEQRVWCDRGTGAKLNVTIFSVVGDEDRDPSLVNSFLPGTWVAVGHYGVPTFVVYCLDRRAILNLYEEEDEEEEAVEGEKKSKNKPLTTSSAMLQRTKSFALQRMASAAGSNAALCPCCEGTGTLGAFGPCEPSSVHALASCPTCDGQGTVTKGVQRCENCAGKGGVGPFGCCDQFSLHYRPCVVCKGRCYLSSSQQQQSS